MQSRRPEGFTSQSSSARLKNHRFELGPDSYMISAYRDSHDERLRRSHRRSLSPHRLEGSKGVFESDRRGTSVERRDYDLHLGTGRSDRIRSRSPPFGQLQERSRPDEWVMRGKRNSPPMDSRRRYELPKHIESNVEASSRYMCDYDVSRISKEKDFRGNRLSAPEDHVFLGQKSMALEDGTAPGFSRLIPDMDLARTSNYRETGRNLSTSARDLGIGRFKDESLPYRNSLSLNKSTVIESFKDEEKPLLYSSRRMVPTSQAKDFLSTSQFKDFASTSSRSLRDELRGSYKEHSILHSGGNFPIGKLTENSDFNEYGQRSLLNTARNPEVGQRDLSSYHMHYPKFGRRESDDFGYPSDDLHRQMPSRAQIDSDLRDFVRTGVMDHVAENINNDEVSYRNMRDNARVLEHRVTDHLDMSRSSNRQRGENLDFGVNYGEFVRRVSRDHETPQYDVMQDQGISSLRLEHGLKRDASRGPLKERLKGSPMSKYDRDLHRFAVRQRIGRSEPRVYDSSHRLLKGKYCVDEEIRECRTRSIVSGKWETPTEIQDRDDRCEWIGDDFFSSERVDFGRNQYRKAERTYDESDYHRHSNSDDWSPYQDSLEHLQERSYKPGGRYIKGHPRPGSLSWYNSDHLNRRSDSHKHHNVWKRSRDDHYVDEYTQEVKPSEEWAIPAKSEPPEDSQEFKQLVHKFFLSFSKKLNENPAIRRRYTEQGKGGSLFCIVCGRSLSKDFMNTQRLVTHAYMSHKFGLRAQHLGLHKAICVLLGWDTVLVPDTVTWVPHVLSYAEAMAQKEDLILWPPLIIVRNSSISDNNPNQKVITIEMLEAFLRGKGFSGGRMKVCLGNPANCSVMVVKFLGTFSGLQGAERLHNHFSENKHGRADLKKVTPKIGKSGGTSGGEGAIQGDKVEEIVLYGYMGIADDMDDVDHETKRRCTIKSKKEIQDLADAPVKPE